MQADLQACPLPRRRHFRQARHKYNDEVGSMESRLTISGSQRCTYQQHLKAHSNLKHILNEEIKISDERMIMQKKAATNKATH
jgi:hypothetical protein